MATEDSAVLLIAHGSPPRDIPRSMLVELRKLHALPNPSSEESARATDLDGQIRNWPRSPETDPYREGTEALIRALKKQLGHPRVLAAYNEFCAPNTQAAVAQLVESGITKVSVFSTMMTPGGGHSERDIPEALAQCRETFPHIHLNYIWPYDLSLVASVITEQLKQSTD